MQNMVMYKQGQDPVVRYIKLRIRRNLNFMAICEGATGCSPKGTKVMLSNGEWKNIEDMKIGDEILSPQTDGSYKFGKIIKLFEWDSNENYDVFQLNKKKEKLYSCSSNHYIPAWHKYRKRNVWEIQDILASDFSNQAPSKKGHQDIGFSSPLIPKFKGRKNCKVEPYTLGVFLGDGMFRDEITKRENKNYNKMKRSNKVEIYTKRERQVNICSPDFEIIEEVSKHYPIMNVYAPEDNKAKTYYFSLKSLLVKQLEDCGLNGKKSGEKFIPKEALYSDAEYRKKLLAGLIDTDGYLSKSHSYSITTKSKQLADDILFLVYSLGGRGTITKIKKQIKELNFEGEYYQVSFFLLGVELPIKVKRKKKEDKSCYLASNRVAIDVKKSRRKEKVYGFTVDTPSHYYITNNFMVTKNSGKTYSMLSLAKQLDPDFSEKYIAFSFRDVMKVVNDEEFKKKKWKVILFDEAQTDINNRTWQSLTNKLLLYLTSTFRHQNIILLLTSPYSDFVDSATMKLIHAKITMKSIDRKKKVAHAKFLLQQYSGKMKKFYQHSLMISGLKGGGVTKLTDWTIPIPPQELIDPYERSKEEFTSALNREIERQLDEAFDKAKKKKSKTNSEPDELKELKPLTEKQTTVFELYNEHKNKQKVAEIMGISYTGVTQHLTLIKNKGYTIEKEDSA